MGVSRGLHAYDALCWGGNVFVCVAIVFVNKVVMKSAGGYGFHYSTCLSALHYVATSLFLWAVRGAPKWRALPARDLWWFTVVSDLSIVSLNLSLMLNSVGLYQIAKLATIPFVCSVEWAWGQRRVTPRLAASLGLVLLGVGLVTVDDPAVRAAPLGAAVAAASVVTSGGQQLLVRRLQQRNAVGPQDMLSVTGPAQAVTLLLVGPGVDRISSGTWVFRYAASLPAAFWIAVSALLAVGVNATQFACLGRFSALSYQVMGHSKTVLVLLGGWLFLGDTLESKRAVGMLLAVGGMVDYARSAAAKGDKGADAAAAAKGAAAAAAPAAGAPVPIDDIDDLEKASVAPTAAAAHSLENGHGRAKRPGAGAGGQATPAPFAAEEAAPSILPVSALVTAASTATQHAASPRAAHAHAHAHALSNGHAHLSHLSPLARDEALLPPAAGARKGALSDGAALRARGGAEQTIRSVVAERSSPSPRAPLPQSPRRGGGGAGGGAAAEWSVQGQAAALGEALTGALTGAIAGLGVGGGGAGGHKTSLQTATKDLAIEALAGWMPEKTEADRV